MIPFLTEIVELVAAALLLAFVTPDFKKIRVIHTKIQFDNISTEVR